MTIRRQPLWLSLMLAVALAGTVLRVHGQGHPGGGGPGGGGPGGGPGGGGPGGPGGGGLGGMGGGINRPGMPGGIPGGMPGNFPGNDGRTGRGDRGDSRRAGESTMSGGLQLGPPGRWWDDSSVARGLGIDSKQQHRMDDVFSANRETLLKLYKNLQHEEKELGKTIRSKNLEEDQIFQHIDRVTQARGELEKANAHMLLQLRKEMSAEQTAKLDEHRPEVQ